MLVSGQDTDALIALRLGLSLQLAYSTDLCAAWQIVAALNARYTFGLSNLAGRQSWLCVIGGHQAVAETAPLAICRAALLVAES